MTCRSQLTTSKFPPKTCRGIGRHWFEKICPPCRSLGFTKADDPRLRVNKK